MTCRVRGPVAAHRRVRVPERLRMGNQYEVLPHGCWKASMSAALNIDIRFLHPVQRCGAKIRTHIRGSGKASK
jgi:hypothetical protein